MTASPRTDLPDALPSGRRPATWRQIPALDGVRGLAALMVVAFHYYASLPAPPAPLARRLYSLAGLGQTGVDLFFVLSGFLITGILLAAKGTPHAWRNFYARRAVRIFPLYYLTLVGLAVAALVAGYGTHALLRSWWYWAYLQNVPLTFFPDFPYKFPVLNPEHFWSLAVEEHFYLVWPSIVLLLPRRALVPTLLSFAAVSAAGSAVFVHFHLSPYFFTLTRLDALSVGSLIAVVGLRPAAVPALVRWSRRLLGGGLLLLAPAFLLAHGRDLAVIEAMKYSLLAVVYGALLVLVVHPAPAAGRGHPGALARAFSLAPLRHVGKYSYAIYVFHPFVLAACLPIVARFPVLARPLCSPLMYLVVLAATYAAAWVSWHAYEARFLKLKKYFEYRPPEDPAPLPPQHKPDPAPALAAP